MLKVVCDKTFNIVCSSQVNTEKIYAFESLSGDIYKLQCIGDNKYMYVGIHNSKATMCEVGSFEECIGKMTGPGKGNLFQFEDSIAFSKWVIKTQRANILRNNRGNCKKEEIGRRFNSNRIESRKIYAYNKQGIIYKLIECPEVGRYAFHAQNEPNTTEFQPDNIHNILCRADKCYQLMEFDNFKEYLNWVVTEVYNEDFLSIGE